MHQLLDGRVRHRDRVDPAIESVLGVLIEEQTPLPVWWNLYSVPGMAMLATLPTAAPAQTIERFYAPGVRYPGFLKYVS